MSVFVQMTLSSDGTCQNSEWFGDVLKKCDSFLSAVILDQDPGWISKHSIK